MIDVEREIRDALRRHEAEIPALDRADAAPAARRARRRQVLNALGATAIVVLVGLALTTGARSVLRSEPHRPADRPPPPPEQTLPPPEQMNGLTPPADAPIAVGSGTSQGWPWLLSASPDGTCIAFTDPQGSESDCTPASELTGASGKTNIVDVYVHSAPPPAPDVVFYFGRVPPETVSVRVEIRTLEATKDQLFTGPDALSIDMGYYVSILSGYPYPYVPDPLVWGDNEKGNSVGAREFKDNGAALERPTWARAPTFTKVESIVTGSFTLFGDTTPWEIAIFRNDATGLLCLGEVGSVSVCGDPDDPLPGWERGIADRCPDVEPCGWPPVIGVGGGGGGGLGELASWGWGVFRDPVVTVREERYGLGGRAGWLDTEVYDVPARYGASFRIFVYQCDDCNSGHTVGFDANGNEVARD